MYLTYNFENKLWMNENPIAELWDLISAFVNPDKLFEVKQFSYYTEFRRIFNYFLTQSLDLYKSSMISSNESSPLLQFYSFSTLTKILVMIQQVLVIVLFVVYFKIQTVTCGLEQHTV